jgi:UDP-perosamine 4-acetyltransferase
MTGLVLIGAGGHAKVVIEALRAAGMPIAGMVAPDAAGAEALGLALLGDDDALPRLRAGGITRAVLALGNNRRRGALAAALRQMGFTLPVVVHPTAWVSPSAVLGEGTVVLQMAAISAQAVAGPAVIVNSGAIVEHDNRLGAAAHIAPGCTLAGSVTVGPRALVGAGSAVRPGITIGADAVVGAGAAVVADVPDGAVVGGNPARPLRRAS